MTDTRSEKQKMLAGERYSANCPELIADQLRIAKWMDRYNASVALAPEAKEALLREAFASVGQGVNIRAPFYCDYGYNISVGDGVFFNFNCIVLDVAKVTIGNHTLLGPSVQILTADHPRDPQERRSAQECARPITIGENVWIGAGALILPGVTIGDNAIIGSGSVVTRDIPANAIAAGNPARVR